MYLVLDGEIRIFDEDLHDQREVFAVHRTGQFTGEMNLFDGREILVNGEASVETRAIRAPRPGFLRLMASEPDIGEIIMRAYVLRRVGIIRYSRLDLADYDRFEGQGIQYATAMEASSAPARRWRSSAAATRPARRHCSSPARPATSTSWCAVPGWRRPCRTIWSAGSRPRPGSPSMPSPR